MKTDSENNMMNQFFSLHSIGGGRFFLLLVLLFNLQMTQAVCRHDASPSDTQPTALFISEGTVVSGMEKIYVTHPAKEKVKKKVKRKNSFISGKKQSKKKENLSQPIKNSYKTELIFSRSHQSDTSLLAVSDGDNPIVQPNQHTMKFLLFKGENKLSLSIHLSDVFLKKDYRNQTLSNLRFFQNFKRPPPAII